jgi:hypothetical protein
MVVARIEMLTTAVGIMFTRPCLIVLNSEVYTYTVELKSVSRMLGNNCINKYSAVFV